jgi:hypothetical protein
MDMRFLPSGDAFREMMDGRDYREKPGSVNRYLRPGQGPVNVAGIQRRMRGPWRIAQMREENSAEGSPGGSRSPPFFAMTLHQEALICYSIARRIRETRDAARPVRHSCRLSAAPGKPGRSTARQEG